MFSALRNEVMTKTVKCSTQFAKVWAFWTTAVVSISNVVAEGEWLGGRYGGNCQHSPKLKEIEERFAATRCPSYGHLGQLHLPTSDSMAHRRLQIR